MKLKIKSLTLCFSLLFSFGLRANYCDFNGDQCYIKPEYASHGCCPGGNNPSTGNPLSGPKGTMSYCGFSQDSSCNYSKSSFTSHSGAANSCTTSGGSWCTISPEGAAHSCCSGFKFQNALSKNKAPACAYNSNKKCNYSSGESWACNPSEKGLASQCLAGNTGACAQACEQFGVYCSNACSAGSKASCCILGGSQDNINDCITACNMGEIAACKNICNNQSGIQSAGYLSNEVKNYKTEACARIEFEYNKPFCLDDAKAKKQEKTELSAAESKVAGLESSLSKTKQDFLTAYEKVKTDIFNYIHPNSQGMTFAKPGFEDKIQDTLDYYGYVQGGIGTENITKAANLANQYKSEASELSAAQKSLSRVQQSVTSQYDSFVSGSISMHCSVVNNFCKAYGQIFAGGMPNYNPCNPVFWQCKGGISSSCQVFNDMCSKSNTTNQAGACYQSSQLCNMGVQSLCQPVLNFCASEYANYPVGPMRVINPCNNTWSNCKKGEQDSCNAIKTACTNSNNNYQEGACYQMGALCLEGINSACQPLYDYCEKNPDGYPTNKITGNSIYGWVVEACKKGKPGACESLTKSCSTPNSGQMGACWQLGQLCLEGVTSACQPVNNYCKNYGTMIAGMGLLNYQPCNAVFWSCKKGNEDSCKVFTDVCGDTKNPLNSQAGACYQASVACSTTDTYLGSSLGPSQSSCDGLITNCKAGVGEACKYVVGMCKKDTSSEACSALNNACKGGNNDVCKPLVGICNDNYKKMGCDGVYDYCANEIKKYPSQINKYSKTGVCGSYINNVASYASGTTRLSALGILLDQCKAKPLSQSCWTWTAQMIGEMEGVKGQGRKPLSTITKECSGGSKKACSMLWDLHLYATGGSAAKGKNWLKPVPDTSTRKQALTELESVCNGAESGKNIACDLIAKNCTEKNMYEYHSLDISGQEVDKTKAITGACLSMQQMCEGGNSYICNKIGCSNSQWCGLLTSSCKADKDQPCKTLAGYCYDKSNKLACSVNDLCKNKVDAACTAVSAYCSKGNTDACNILIGSCSKGVSASCNLLQTSCKGGSKLACSGLYNSLNATCKAGNKTACTQLQTDCKSGIKDACNALYSTLEASCAKGTQSACNQLQTDCSAGSSAACTGLYNSLSSGCKAGQKEACTQLVSDCTTKNISQACSTAESLCQSGVYPMCAALCNAGKSGSCSFVTDACKANNLDACNALTATFKLGSNEINDVQTYCKNGVANACQSLIQFCTGTAGDMTPDGIELCGTICRSKKAGAAAGKACVALGDLCVYQQDIDSCVQANIPNTVNYDNKSYWTAKVKSEISSYCGDNPSADACVSDSANKCAATGTGCEDLAGYCNQGSKNYCDALDSAFKANQNSQNAIMICQSYNYCQPALSICGAGSFATCDTLMENATGDLASQVKAAANSGCKANNNGACEFLRQYNEIDNLKSACGAGATNACAHIPKVAPTGTAALEASCNQNILSDCKQLCSSQATSTKPTGCWKLYDDCKSNGGTGQSCTYLQSLCSTNNKSACWQLRELAPTYTTYVLNNLYESCRALPDASSPSRWGNAYGWPCQYLYDVCTKNNISKACGQVATACQGNSIPACMAMYWLFSKYPSYKNNMVSYCSRGTEAACQLLTEAQLQSISSSSNGAKYLQMCKDKKTLMCS